MKIIHDNGYSEEQKLAYRSLVNSNTIQNLFIILQAMDTLNITFGKEDNAAIAQNFSVQAEGKIKKLEGAFFGKKFEKIG
jgi:guanine nucleotide-binding protein G(i) subunit alpha